MEAQRLPQENLLTLSVNVKQQTWKHLEGLVKQLVKSLIEDLLKAEFDQQIGAKPYQRTRNRRSYRNGHYGRDLSTKYGLIENLKVPRAQEGGLNYTLFDRYQRRQEAVDAAIGRLFVEGISTRKLRRIIAQLYDQGVSAQTVSRTTRHLDQELKVYQTKPLPDDVEFLFLDGITQKLRQVFGVKKTVLCAYGIRPHNLRVMLSFRIVDGESQANWSSFLADLKARGLLGSSLKLITVDGNPGLLAALKEHYTFVPVQRCIAHKMRNVAVKIKRCHQKPCLDEARKIWAASSRQEALDTFKAWKDKWFVPAERAVLCLEKDLHECLHYYEFDQASWKTIRTTNVLERAFREVRRRTKIMGVLPNQKSAERILLAVTQNLNQTYPGNTQSKFPQLS